VLGGGAGRPARPRRPGGGGVGGGAPPGGARARALALDADLYHLHDPELLFVALALKRRGGRVVFDAHEDVPRQILSKSYLPAAARGPVAAAVGMLERFACRRLDAVVAATPAIRDKFARLGIAAMHADHLVFDDQTTTAFDHGRRDRRLDELGER
jgi:hypothetical protein